MESVVTPVMMNRPITDSRGCLTQYGYSILAALQIRTGGIVGEVIDVEGLQEQITSVQEQADLTSLAPDRGEHVKESAEGADALVYALLAEVATLRTMVEDLQKGYQI
jgi:hypothetical protein